MTAVRWRQWAQCLWQAPDAPVALSSWLLVAALGAVATVLYWLGPEPERFELWLRLPAPPTLPADWLPVLLVLRDRVPDVAWALLLGCCLRDLIWALRLAVPGIAIVLAAASWELGQWLSLLPGYFDVVDLGLSAIAGGLALAVPGKGEPR